MELGNHMPPMIINRNIYNNCTINVTHQNNQRDISMNIDHAGTVQQELHAITTVVSPATSQNIETELGNDAVVTPQSPDDGIVTSQGPTLKEVYNLEDMPTLLETGRLEEAFQQTRKWGEYDGAIYQFKQQIALYESCAEQGMVEKLNPLKDFIKQIVLKKFQTTPYQAEEFGEFLRNEKEFIKAILFFQIAADFYGNGSVVALRMRSRCVFEIMISVITMLGLSMDMRSLVKTHVKPIMHGILAEFPHSGVKVEDRCSMEVLCMVCVALVTYKLDEEPWIKVLEEAEKKMLSVYKDAATQHYPYGICLYYLAVGNEYASEYANAKEYYKKAISALHKAIDITDEQRMKVIEDCKEGLKKVEKSK